MDKVYLITGATGDIGRALMQRVYSKGDKFIVQGFGDLDKLDEFEAAHPGSLYRYDVDLSDRAAVEEFADKIAEECPLPTHIVHLPALPVINTRFRQFDEGRFEKDFAIQVKSAITICKKIVPLMAKQKYGHILFMQTSYALGAPPKNTSSYVISKTALTGLAKSLAVEYAASGINVNLVSPSMIETHFLADTPDLIVEMAAKNNPMGRNARIDDVIPAMAFLLSDEASYITGVNLPITGGSLIL